MAPNAKMPFALLIDDHDNHNDNHDHYAYNNTNELLLHHRHRGGDDEATVVAAAAAAAAAESSEILLFLDSKSDTSGLRNLEGEDWTDVKHSERKKRDRILDDGILLSLMKKSDYQGFKRLTINLSILALTAYCIASLQVFQFNNNNSTDTSSPFGLVQRLIAFVPLYAFYGFQFQAFAFAGLHEFLHRNAFKTKWINDYILFVVGCVCFEFGKHERVMHKQVRPMPTCLCTLRWRLFV
jgi:hypothetical protein